MAATDQYQLLDLQRSRVNPFVQLHNPTQVMIGDTSLRSLRKEARPLDGGLKLSDLEAELHKILIGLKTDAQINVSNSPNYPALLRRLRTEVLGYWNDYYYAAGYKLKGKPERYTYEMTGHVTHALVLLARQVVEECLVVPGGAWKEWVQENIQWMVFDFIREKNDMHAKLLWHLFSQAEFSHDEEGFSLTIEADKWIQREELSRIVSAVQTDDEIQSWSQKRWNNFLIYKYFKNLSVRSMQLSNAPINVVLQEAQFPYLEPFIYLARGINLAEQIALGQEEA